MPEATEGTLFKAEYEHELERWLRRRYGFFLGCTIGLRILVLLVSTSTMLFLRGGGSEALTPEQRQSADEIMSAPVLSITLMSTLLVLAVAARAFIVVRSKLETREQTLRSASWFIIQIGAIDLLSDGAVALISSGTSFSNLGGLFGLHFLACLFLPWTPRESLRPMYPLIGLFLIELVIFLIMGRLETGEVVLHALGVPFVLIPGIWVCWLRLRRRRRQFNREMVAKGFFSMRRELSQARAVQLALFPKPIQTQSVDFDFAYVPANEVGGDFIHASIDERGRLDVVVLDVTGHGLASALTVSRLSGEIERLLAEDPDMEPGHVLRMLNRYVNLTLSRHSVYATALCVQVCPMTGEVKYANAGHPPAFVRRADGSVERFDSTTWLLGAAPDSMFEDDQLTFVLGSQDTLVLVTDGVHEAPDRKGERFGIDRLHEALQKSPAPARWSEHIASAADNWRKGLGDDDLLVASVRVPLAVPAPASGRVSVPVQTSGPHHQTAPLHAPESGAQA
jgi:hypothetical protein